MARPYSFNPSMTVHLWRWIDAIDAEPYMTVPAMQMTPWLSFSEEVIERGVAGYISRFLVSPTVPYIGGYLDSPSQPYRIKIEPALGDIMTVIDAWPIMDGPAIHCWLVHAVRSSSLIEPPPEADPPESVVLTAPVGMIMAYAPATVLLGWDKCGGQGISRETYAELFSLIGVNYGAGDGVSTFNLPNLGSKVILGEHPSAISPFLRGESGGAVNTTLVIANLPPHGHQVPYSLNVGSSGTVRLGDAGTGGAFTTGLSNGASLPFSRFPPYQVVPYIIKVLNIPGHY